MWGVGGCEGRMAELSFGSRREQAGSVAERLQADAAGAGSILTLPVLASSPGKFGELSILTGNESRTTSLKSHRERSLC